MRGKRKKLIINAITSGDRLEIWKNKDQIASITINSKKRSGNIRVKDKSLKHPLLLEGFDGMLAIPEFPRNDRYLYKIYKYLLDNGFQLERVEGPPLNYVQF